MNDVILFDRDPRYIPRVAAVHDMCGYGKCSLTAAIPILSAAGCDVCPVPTALFSAHTRYSVFTFHDTTEILDGYLDAWRKENVDLDGVYSGFLGSAEQVAIIKRLYADYPHALRLVDPVMGDHGRRYATYTQLMCEAMGALCAQADVITPNLTEAAFLLDLDYASLSGGGKEGLELARALSEGGRRSVVLTGVSSGEGMVGAACYDRASGRAGLVMAPRVEGEYHGTGDIFASVLTGGLVGGMELEQAAALAARFVSQCAERTRRQAYPRREGVDFEPLLGWLARERGL